MPDNEMQKSETISTDAQFYLRKLKEENLTDVEAGVRALTVTDEQNLYVSAVTGENIKITDVIIKETLEDLDAMEHKMPNKLYITSKNPMKFYIYDKINDIFVNVNNSLELTDEDLASKIKNNSDAIEGLVEFQNNTTDALEKLNVSLKKLDNDQDSMKYDATHVCTIGTNGAVQQGLLDLIVPLFNYKSTINSIVGYNMINNMGAVSAPVSATVLALSKSDLNKSNAERKYVELQKLKITEGTAMTEVTLDTPFILNNDYVIFIKIDDPGSSAGLTINIITKLTKQTV